MSELKTKTHIELVDCGEDVSEFGGLPSSTEDVNNLVDSPEVGKRVK